MNVSKLMPSFTRKKPQVDDFVSAVNPFLNRAKDTYKKQITLSPMITHMTLSSNTKNAKSIVLATHAPDFKFIRFESPKMTFAVLLDEKKVEFFDKPIGRGIKHAYKQLSEFMQQFNMLKE